MGKSARIVVVDDDAEIRDVLSEYLAEYGFRVSVADGGAALRRLLERDGDPDLIVLDLMMPDEHGLDIVRDVRKRSNVGIIILTGTGEAVDSVLGLELGADDYLSKPCDLRDLLARVRSVLRRTKTYVGQAPATEQASLAFAGWRLDQPSRRLTSPDGSDVPLTTAEFDLLATFAQSSNRVLSRDQLLDAIHGRDWSPLDRSIDNLVSQVRRKIESDPKNPNFIKSVRGVGYMFTSKVTRT